MNSTGLSQQQGRSCKLPHPGFRAFYSAVRVTITSHAGGDETPAHEASSLDLQIHTTAGAEDREEEVATEDPEVGGEDEHCEGSVWEVDEAPSLSLIGHQATEGGALSPSAGSTMSAPSSHVQANAQQATSPIEEIGHKEPPAITPSNLGELPGPRDRSTEENSLVEDDCPSSCPPNELEEPAAPGTQVLKGIRRRWKQEPPDCTSVPPTGVEPTETNESANHKAMISLGRKPIAGHSISCVRCCLEQ